MGQVVLREQAKETGPVLTVKDLAEYWGVTTRTVYRLLKECNLPACRVGGQWRFEAESIEAWMQGRGDRMREGGGAP